MADNPNEAKDIPVGKPVAVTLLEQESYDMFDFASKGGVPKFWGEDICLTDCFAMLGLADDLGASRLPIIVVNALPVPLKRGSLYDKHCYQNKYPVRSNLAVYPTPIAGYQILADEIPGAMPHPLKKGVTLYGAGVYNFEKSSGVYYNDGALSLQCGLVNLGIAWSVDNTDRADNHIAITPDLGGAKYGGDLTAFYDATVGVSANYKVSVFDKNDDVSINASLSGGSPGGSHSLVDFQRYVVVSVRPR